MRSGCRLMLQMLITIIISADPPMGHKKAIRQSKILSSKPVSISLRFSPLQLLIRELILPSVSRLQRSLGRSLGPVNIMKWDKIAEPFCSKSWADPRRKRCRFSTKQPPIVPTEGSIPGACTRYLSPEYGLNATPTKYSSNTAPTTPPISSHSAHHKSRYNSLICR